MLIKRSFVINRRDRPQRLTAFLTRWQASPATQLTVELYTAPAARDATAGCLAAHLAVMRLCGNEPTLIMEDDICFTAAFPYHTSPPPDWQVLWLGGEHIAPPRASHPGWVTPVEMMRTHAYIAANPAQLAATFVATHPPRIDPYLARLPLAQYCAEPQTAGQVAGPSDTGGTDLTHDTYWHRTAPTTPASTTPASTTPAPAGRTTWR
jgi:hypothetical protein